ncbi:MULTISPECIES: tyrosine-type recombinase/integrase [Mongoliitalea]|uniref:Tyrosine recombinase XerC n=1 Tax=Mongoliitalea lutea TaxID=849756 RepID=A0A8J3CUW3_9BACT|nr:MULTISPECIES: tyrosine-type recombinase/integrase [Mongoliitalea]UJP66323.1 tyrosine-type recombinase/integrase [Mongoliitalea daihaiensis]GHB30269.1 tyrosine recombinase XerC [Mongoliitalea lutea]
MVESFINYLEYEKRASAHTVLAYRKDLEQFAEFCKTSFEKEDISLAEHAEIRAWVIDLVDTKLSPTSINRKIATLRSFYKFLLRSGEISKDPTYKIKALKTPKRLPEFVQEEAIDKILEEINYPIDFEGQRDRMVMDFLYLTGVRLSELTQLQWKDIDLAQQQVKVFGKRKKERIIPIISRLQENIISYKKVFEETFPNTKESDYFIVTKEKEQAYPMMIYRIVRHYLDLFAQTTKRSPHLLRHTFATHLLNKGADLNAVKDLLGHANLAATQVYTHNSMEKLKAVYNQAHPKA